MESVGSSSTTNAGTGLGDTALSRIRNSGATFAALTSPVIVAGMPRSGKAIVAQALGRAGVFLGDNLKGPTRHNPEGYFEDLDIIALHDELLASNNALWNISSTLSRLHVEEAQRARALSLVREKFICRDAWGWKDPRTTLFIDMWEMLLPEPRWIFVVRRPAEVAAEILARGDLKKHAGSRVSQVRLALQLWTIYHRRIRDFAMRAPDRTLIMAAPDDLTGSGANIVDDVVRTTWEMPIRPLSLSQIFIPALMKRSVSPWLETMAMTHRSSLKLYDELVELREKRWINHIGEAGVARAREDSENRREDEPVVCLVAPQEFAYSETFVRDHIRWMPARTKVLYAGTPRPATSDAEVPWYDKLNYAWNFPNRSADGSKLQSLPGRLVDLAWQYGLRRTGHPCAERAFVRYLQRENVDAVFAEFGQTGTWIMKACEEAEVPLIVQFHGSEAYRQRWIEAYLPQYEAMFEIADAIVAVSRDMVEQLLGLGAPREKVYYNPCGVDVDFFSGADPAAATPHYLAVGRFVEKKAPYLTLIAFAKVFEQCPDARLTMVGDGNLLEPCQHIARGLGLGEVVDFPGVVSQLEIADLMRASRAFVQHSIRPDSGDSEGTPVSIMEAAASGLPIVGTRHGGIQDAVLDGETGFLVDEGDVQGMAEHMLQLAGDPKAATSMGRRGRKHIREQLSMEKSMETLGEIIAVVTGREGE